jgi:hypothetical protein
VRLKDIGQHNQQPSYHIVLPLEARDSFKFSSKCINTKGISDSNLTDSRIKDMVRMYFQGNDDCKINMLNKQNMTISDLED